jgi:soluble lytic murein transglycosylase-like protein
MKKKIIFCIIALINTNACVSINLPSIYIENSSNLSKDTSYKSLSNISYFNFIKRNSYKLEDEKINKYILYIEKYSKEYNVNPKIILSLIARESNFRENVVSSSGAIGLGQLMPETAKDMNVNDPYNPEENIKGTVKYISWLLKRNNGDLFKSLAGYNMGPGAVERTSKIPSSVEKYVNDILKNMETIV